MKIRGKEKRSGKHGKMVGAMQEIQGYPLQYESFGIVNR